MLYFLLLAVTVLFFIIYIFEIKKIKFSIRTIFLIALFGAISYVLNTIKFLRMPQGGSITFFSMLPVMLVSIVHSKGAGLTCGILSGILKTLDGAVFLNPLQFILDYILANMVLGFSGIFGRKNKFRIILGCVLSGFISVVFNILSGVLFFGEFAPENTNVWIYSILYNFSSVGVEVILTVVVLGFMPLHRIIKNFKA